MNSWVKAPDGIALGRGVLSTGAQGVEVRVVSSRWVSVDEAKW